MKNNQILNVLGFATLFSYNGFFIHQTLEYIYEKYYSLIGDVDIKSDNICDENYKYHQTLVERYEEGWNCKLSIKDINLLIFVIKAGDFNKKPINIINYFKECINTNTININNKESYKYKLHHLYNRELNTYITKNIRFFKLNSFVYE